ncbi:MAG: Sulfate permease 2 [Phylliscum demangeonii]|nr:MAG: Sulfate permease 2 [Phylliscum demangeonii]
MPQSTATKVGHALAKVLAIKLHYRSERGQDELTRGESIYSVSSASTYVEQEPTTLEWIRDQVPAPKDLFRYARNLFPFTHWITRYNGPWLIGDLIAGITVGIIVVPQSMAYAGLAQLAPEFGLYSSFMGVLIYWFFATSKDITIGPVAVASTVVGNIVLKAKKTQPHVPADIIASAVAVLAGSIILFIGLVRCGWIVEFISLTAISAFMTGSAINIAVAQVPALMGIKGFSNRDATYKVTINILKHLGRTQMDAAMGLTALAMLYLIRSASSIASRRLPRHRRLFFFLASLRTAFVILLYTMISWLVNQHRRKTPRFAILGTVPRGFKHARVPTITTDIIKSFASELPATVIVLLIEHIAIAKSFGRVNGYTIDPSQELVAIGVTNVLGPFLGAYPATGSFSRTAIKSKAGVRTPFAGVITAVVVLLAIYALPAVFFYIPSASLAAVIIHAVGDLITPPNTVYQFWRTSPLEVIIFFAGVFVTIFSSIENGIYTTIGISAAVLLFRVVKARGRFLGKVKIHSIVPDGKDAGAGSGHAEPSQSTTRDLFLPIDHHDGSNPQVELESPYPGIFIYRFSEGFNYPNANHYLDYLTATVFAQTRRTNSTLYARRGDRPWNDPGPRRGQVEVIDTHRPTLKAIIIDFSSVNNVDVTSVQHLIDVRNQLDRWAAPDTVEWHFACITNRWTKRALASAGFGYPSLAPAADVFQPKTGQSAPPPPVASARWKPIFNVTEIGGADSVASTAERLANRRSARLQDPPRSLSPSSSSAAHGSDDFRPAGHDDDFIIRHELTKVATASAGMKKLAVVHGINRPLFHIDLTSALQSAIANVEWKTEVEKLEKGGPP